MSPRSNRKKPALGQRSTSKKHVTLMSSQLEPAIWPRITGQRIPWIDRCQLSITWLSNIKEEQCKYLVLGRHVARLCRRRRRRHRAYAPTSNTASHDNHEKIHSWVSSSFPRMMSVGLRLAALRAAGAPLLMINSKMNLLLYCKRLFLQ